jgi:hypothetical protein
MPSFMDVRAIEVPKLPLPTIISMARKYERAGCPRDKGADTTSINRHEQLPVSAL